jgi:polysaccharide biosynthesis transport protein
MSFGQFISIIAARWKLAALVMLICLCGSIGISLLMPKRYSAVTALLLDVRASDPVAGVFQPATSGPSFLATQIDIITSDRVASRVVSNLKLEANPGLKRQWQEATQGAGNFEAWIGQLLKKNLEVKPARESNVVNLNFRGSDPQFTSIVANAFGTAYLETVLELRNGPSKSYAGFFDERSKNMRETLEKAQTRLSKHQKTTGITASEERLDVETTRLNELSSQLVAIQAVSVDSASRQVQAKKSADQIQEVLQNPVVSGLKSDLARQEARSQEMSAKLGASHPQMIEIQANIAELKVKIDNETKKIVGGVGVSASINRQRESEIRSSLDSQRAKVLKLKEARDELAVLQRDVESAQKAYDIVLARGTQTTLESLNQQTNVAVLNPATVPNEYSSPKYLLNTALGIGIGALLAILAALLREMTDKRVRSADDITMLTELSTIGVLPGPDKKRLFRNAQPSLMQSRILRQLPGATATKAIGS